MRRAGNVIAIAAMDQSRTNPDEPLEQLRQETQTARRGRLKIFFGYAAGVGKTYSMLEAARAQAVAGADVVLGYVEPHARPETQALMADLKALPPRQIDYRGVSLREFDLDGALARRPALLIVDEYAHTNAPGSRHPKRWQDVDELLEAGINVYTTLNVQHVETLNDIVAQISGIQVRERIPDAVFDRADSIELVDLPPEELLQRFHEGKVYVPAQAERAMARFFQLPNLIALRELSLRRAADRVNAQVESARAAPESPWTTGERLLVCVGPSPTSARVIRVTKRMASSLHAPWIAVHVDTGAILSDAGRTHLTANLNLAGQLGAEIVTLSGQDLAEEVVKYAHSARVTKIVIGKTSHSRWRDLTGRSMTARLLRLSGDVDVYVVRGAGEKDAPAPLTLAPRRAPMDYAALGKAAGVATACTGLAWLLARSGLAATNQVMVYFLGVAFVAARYGRWPGILASVLSVLEFDFFLVPPYLTFAVHDAQYFITFGVMLVISILISGLTDRVRRQGEAARQRERRTQVLYRLTRRLAGLSGTAQLVAEAESQLGESYASEVAVFLPDEAGRLRASAGSPASFAGNQREIAVAQWVFEHGRLAGTGTDTLPDAQALYLPLAGPQGPVGVLALRPIDIGRFDAPDQRQLLETLASQIALAVERDRLAEQAQKVLLQAQTERLRSSLLSSVSHDLRTPLAVIAGASSSLLDSGQGLPEPTRHELLSTIVEESNRLALLVDNLLHITRIESGAVVVNKQWQPLEEVVGSALERMKKQLAGRPVQTHLAADLPLAAFDGVLVEQVLVNLLENAARYTPAGSPIDVSARIEGNAAVLEVADRGPGLSDEERHKIFEKFYRGLAAGKGSRGAGLGLAICRAVVQAHGGRIWQQNRPGGGARFIFSLPLEGAPPAMDVDNPPAPVEQ
ncbi:MAG: sensor histidine kinase KdpD [Planctomycetota bacterium]|nr:sensor histidine kinase KdpD [Planctomycetota bacterium]